MTDIFGKIQDSMNDTLGTSFDFIARVLHNQPVWVAVGIAGYLAFYNVRQILKYLLNDYYLSADLREGSNTTRRVNLRDLKRSIVLALAYAAFTFWLTYIAVNIEKLHG